jgi:two-component system cell cycle sensor histidine kinase/response regulator CckA
MVRTPSQKVAVYALSSEMTPQEKAGDTISDLPSDFSLGSPASGNSRRLGIVEQMPALLWTTDLDLNVLQVQGNGLGRLQRNSQYLAGVPLGEFFENEAASFPVLAAHSSALGGHAQAFEFSLVGAAFWGIAEPLFGADWNLIGTIGVAVDISLRKNAEEQRLAIELRRRETEKRQSLMHLAGGMAHHFNNLLTGILGYTSVARAQLAPDHPLHGVLQEIEKIAFCAAGLTDQCLCFGQRLPKKMVAVNLSSLIRENFAAYKAMLGNSITLRCDLMEDLPALAGDPEQLGRMMASFLSQASETIGAGEGLPGEGTVVLRTQVVNGPPQILFDERSVDTQTSSELPDGEYIWLQVSDTGCGLDDETKARMFEPFPRGPESGRNLGLATALGVVHGHRGAITVSSKPGLGTTYHVFLPVLDQGAQPGPESFF